MLSPALFILFACGFLLLVMLVEHVSRCSAVPSVGWMLLLGLGYGLARRLGLDWMPGVSLSPDLVIFGFLPLLIFNSSRLLHVRVLVSELAEIGYLSFVGPIIGMVLLALPLVWHGSMGWMDALLFGAALSTTDPVAVGAIMRRLRVPPRLLALIEGESLLNDAFVLILFSALSAVVLDHTALSASRTAGEFVYALLGAVVLGALAGGLGGLLLRKWRELPHRFIGAAFPLIVVYGTFALAHSVARVSGVIAVVAATLTLSSLHTHRHDKTADQRRADTFFDDFWGFLATLANGALFFGMGVMVGQHRWLLPWFLVPAVGAAMVISRAMTVYPLVLVSRITRRRIPTPWMHMINASGLRGGLSVALLLTLPSAYPHRMAMVCLAFALLLFGLAAYVVADRLYLRDLTLAPVDAHERSTVETCGVAGKEES